jgi:tyrosyl-tRNA synthetase
MNAEEQIQIIKQGTAQVLPLEDLKKKLARNKPLKIKLGADPTAPDLHLGHAVVLSKLRQFQDLGHEVLFLIGDYTARIGDPSGRSKTRPPLTPEDIQRNMQTYFEQVKKILIPEKLTICYNSSWLEKLSGYDWVKLCGKATVAQIIEREDFAQRIAEKRPVGMHELLYPLMQGYDSVALNADVEIGGTDQTFNLMFGRHLQEQFDQEPQVVLTMPLLEGLDGKQKMSKSLGNAIGLAEPADQAFGKLMSISDELVWRYLSLLLHVEPERIAKLQEQVAQGIAHPMDVKKNMAEAIVAKFWSTQEAAQARTQFEALFQRHDMSAAQEFQIPAGTANPLWIVDLLKLLQAVKSSSDAKRLIEQGAVSIDEQVITDFRAMVVLSNAIIVKAGKHKIFKILV